MTEYNENPYIEWLGKMPRLNGKYLDRLGVKMYGIKRRGFLIWKESDDEYRERILVIHMKMCLRDK